MYPGRRVRTRAPLKHPIETARPGPGLALPRRSEAPSRLVRADGLDTTHGRRPGARD
jgi:hypothetical protein